MTTSGINASIHVRASQYNENLFLPLQLETELAIFRKHRRKTAPRKIINNQEAQWGPRGRGGRGREGRGRPSERAHNYVEKRKEGFALDTAAAAAAAVVGRERRRAAQEGY